MTRRLPGLHIETEISVEKMGFSKTIKFINWSFVVLKKNTIVELSYDLII